MTSRQRSLCGVRRVDRGDVEQVDWFKFSRLGSDRRPGGCSRPGGQELGSCAPHTAPPGGNGDGTGTRWGARSCSGFALQPRPYPVGARPQAGAAASRALYRVAGVGEYLVLSPISTMRPSTSLRRGSHTWRTAARLCEIRTVPIASRSRRSAKRSRMRPARKRPGPRSARRPPGPSVRRQRPGDAMRWRWPPRTTMGSRPERPRQPDKAISSRQRPRPRRPGPGRGTTGAPSRPSARTAEG